MAGKERSCCGERKNNQKMDSQAAHSAAINQRRTAIASISIFTSFGERATSTEGAPGKRAIMLDEERFIVALTVAKSFESFTKTVVSRCRPLSGLQFPRSPAFSSD